MQNRATRGRRWKTLAAARNEIPLGTEWSCCRGWKVMQTVKSRNLFGGGGMEICILTVFAGITRSPRSNPRIKTRPGCRSLNRRWRLFRRGVIGECEIQRNFILLEGNDKRARARARYNFLKLFHAADLTTNVYVNVAFFGSVHLDTLSSYRSHSFPFSKKISYSFSEVKFVISQKFGEIRTSEVK